MKPFIDVFEHVKATSGSKIFHATGLVCKVGTYGGCAVLKLQKKSWTNDDMTLVPNHSGVFFSIWVGEKDLKKNRVSYNIHALKIKELKGYQIKKSREFADDFRKRFKPFVATWPNVSVDFGPLTLMEGWIPIDLQTFEKDTVQLMNRFIEMHSTIDETLEMMSK